MAIVELHIEPIASSTVCLHLFTISIPFSRGLYLFRNIPAQNDVFIVHCKLRLIVTVEVLSYLDSLRVATNDVVFHYDACRTNRQRRPHDVIFTF